jgi:hypothetical protein
LSPSKRRGADACQRGWRRRCRRRSQPSGVHGRRDRQGAPQPPLRPISAVPGPDVARTVELRSTSPAPVGLAEIIDPVPAVPAGETGSCITMRGTWSPHPRKRRALKGLPTGRVDPSEGSAGCSGWIPRRVSTSSRRR